MFLFSACVHAYGHRQLWRLGKELLQVISLLLSCGSKGLRAQISKLSLAVGTCWPKNYTLKKKVTCMYDVCTGECMV